MNFLITIHVLVYEIATSNCKNRNMFKQSWHQ